MTDLALREADSWPGLPEQQNAGGAPMYAVRVGQRREPRQFCGDLVTAGSLARKTFTSPHGLNVISKMNDPLVRAQPIVSFGGIGSASALAKFYSMLANDGKADGQTFFSGQTLEWMRTILSD